MLFDRHAKTALIIACLTLIAAGLGFRYAIGALNIYLRKEAVPLRGSFATISKSFDQWRQVGDDIVLDDAVLQELGTRDTITRAYVRGEDTRTSVLHVHVAYYTGMIDAVPHIPDRCFVASGLEPRTLPEVVPLRIDRSAWRVDPGPANVATGEPYFVVDHRHPFTNQIMVARMPVGDIELRMTEFARSDQPGLRFYGGFFFIANGRASATPESIRALAFRPSERAAYYCKVQLSLAGQQVTREHYLSLVEDFLSRFLPELMLRLPDWQEIEQQHASSPQAAGPARVSG